MQELKCSVVIPVYNAERYIEQTVRSVMNQTVKEIEIICVNDCSTDNSVEIIKKLQLEDSRIKLINNEKNSKVSVTRNNGIKVANASWIALLDADDMWEANFLEEVIKARDEKNARLVCTSEGFMTNEGEKLDKCFIIDGEITYKQLLKQNKISASAVFVEKDLLLKYPFFYEEAHEDYLCWLSILKEIKVCYAVNKPLSYRRLTVGSKSRNKVKALKMSWKTYRKHGLNVFKSFYYLACNALNGLKKYKGVK